MAMAVVNVAEGRRLHDRLVRGMATGDQTEQMAASMHFSTWLRDNFGALCDAAEQTEGSTKPHECIQASEPFAHMLADADQALTELEMALDEHPFEKLVPVMVGPVDRQRNLRDYVGMLRAAIEGTDYRR